MATERIYRNNVYEKSNFATIVSVTERDGKDVIVTDASVLFPEGGGQACDIGTVSKGELRFAISETYDESLEGDVFHVTDAPAGSFAVGDRVELALNWDRRFQNMQRHLGEHMLSGCLYNLFGGVNRGFHMGEDYITIDIDLGGRMLSAEELSRAAETVNKAIWDDLPVTVTYFDNYEDSRVMPVRKDVPHDGRVSVVTVWGHDDVPFDCIACCGTHPSSTGQVGIISVYKLEANKGMNRIYFDCGIMAYRRLTRNMSILNEIACRHSSGADDLLHKLDVRDAKEAQLRDRLFAVTQYAKEGFLNDYMPRVIAKLGKAAGSDAANCDAANKYAVIRSSLFDVNELLKIGFKLAGKLGENLADNSVLILVDENSGTALLYGGAAVNCGALVKESASAFGGKGGGKTDNARAVFGNIDDINAWLCKLNAEDI